MSNPFFHFKQFTVYHDRTAMKVTTDACLFGAWCADLLCRGQYIKDEILEVGAGTGLLSLMLAQKNKVAIDAVEIDAAAAEQAIENIAASSWKADIHIHHADVLQFESKKQYDCIISNPPFYENEIESANKKKNIAHHGHGLKLTDLFQCISRLLKPDGWFFLLLPYKRLNEAERLIKNQPLSLLKKTIVRQSVHHDPFRVMLAGTNSRFKSVIEEDEMAIWDESRQYTPDFIALLRDYYLYL